MATPSEQKQLRILLVDDDDQVREILTDMLSLNDHEVVPACDGHEALNLLGSGNFDLIVTDLGMPGMSGLELAEKVRETLPDIPIALVTGWGSQLDAEDAASKGISAVLGKPFKLKEIHALIARLTAGSNSHSA